MENSLAIICACLPVYRPGFTQGLLLYSKLRSWIFSHVGSVRESRKPVDKQSLGHSTTTRSHVTHDFYQEVPDNDKLVPMRFTESPNKSNSTDRNESHLCATLHINGANAV